MIDRRFGYIPEVSMIKDIQNRAYETFIRSKNDMLRKEFEKIGYAYLFDQYLDPIHKQESKIYTSLVEKWECYWMPDSLNILKFVFAISYTPEIKWVWDNEQNRVIVTADYKFTDKFPIFYES